MAKTVLIVDDVDFVRSTLANILNAAKYQIVGEAKDGISAIELYAKLKPDIVTMDVVMPRMSGIEATKRITKMDQDAKIVIISAMEQEHLVMEAINAGARDYVLKPFKAKDILMTLEHLLYGQVTDESASAGR